MRDIVSRVPALSFINMDDILVFARFGRLHTDGAFATCHCLSLPPSEPGYYFWRDRATGAMTRRSEWFVTKSPTRDHQRAADEVPDLVHAPALLRPVAGSIEKGTLLPEGQRRMDRETRYCRSRAVSHRSRRSGRSVESNAQTAPMLPSVTDRSSSSRSRRWCRNTSTHDPTLLRTISSMHDFDDAERQVRRRRGRKLQDDFRPIRSDSSSGSRRSPPATRRSRRRGRAVAHGRRRECYTEGGPARAAVPRRRVATIRR